MARWLLALLFCATANAAGFPEFEIERSQSSAETAPSTADPPAPNWRKFSVGACVGLSPVGGVLFGVEFTAALDTRISLVTRFDAIYDFFFEGSVVMIGGRFDTDKSATKSLHFECGAVVAAGKYFTSENPDDFVFGGGNYIGIGWEFGNRTVRFTIDLYLMFHTDLSGLDIQVPLHVGLRIFL